MLYQIADPSSGESEGWQISNYELYAIGWARPPMENPSAVVMLSVALASAAQYFCLLFLL